MTTPSDELDQHNVEALCRAFYAILRILQQPHIDKERVKLIRAIVSGTVQNLTEKK